MDVSKSIREFKFNGVAIKDPDPSMSVEKVRETLSNLYPDILNAAIEGPEIVGNKTVYEFRRAVGTKGAGELRARVKATIAGNAPMPSALSYRFDLDAHQALARLFVAAAAPSRGDRLPAPSELLAPLP